MEWEFTEEIARGATGKRARLIQEWLCLQGLSVVVDGKYGPATAEAVRRFQQVQGIGVTGAVNRKTFEALVSPLLRARGDLAPGTLGLGALAVAYATRHLQEHPREVGGQNRGPWVRLYMRGNEGEPWPWCAGFASFVLQQAASTLGASMPVRASFSCDLLAADAKRSRRFLGGDGNGRPGTIPDGSLFLSRRTSGDWVHTGFAFNAGEQTFETIEGNTNDAGEREGYEVCRRVRSYGRKDFIVVS